MPERETSAEIASAAADWAARVDRGPLSEVEEAQLDAWRAADKRRDGAYVRAHAVLARFDRAQALGSTYDPRKFEDRWLPFMSRRQLLWGGGGAIAASTAGVIVGAAILGRTSQYVAKRGEVRLVALSDGSVMTLNSASKVAVSYTGERRELHLIDGEALFDVAKNPNRPFIVDAGDAQVRAVGTSFSVKRIAGRPTEVVVREGVVEVTRASAAPTASPKPASPAVRVTANEMVVASLDAPIVAQTLSPSDLSSALAWKDGMIAFKRTPLKVAAEEFARYSDTPIVIDDPDVGDRTITGLFSAYNPTGFAQAAAGSLDIRARVEDGKVHLSR
jgi:transmembrane sensor